MALSKLDGCELPAAADMHVHLRDGAMTELVVYEKSSLQHLDIH
jgi:dihydroorotase